jgi:large-conductance mechanosensitive channel
MRIFDNYYDFFEKFNILGLAIGLMIGASLKDVADNFIEDALMPFINPILKKLSVTTHGNKIHIPSVDVVINLEKIISSFVKFIALSMLIFLLMQLGIRVRKRPRRVKITNWKSISKSKSRSNT